MEVDWSGDEAECSNPSPPISTRHPNSLSNGHTHQSPINNLSSLHPQPIRNGGDGDSQCWSEEMEDEDLVSDDYSLDETDEEGEEQLNKPTNHPVHLTTSKLVH